MKWVFIGILILFVSSCAPQEFGATFGDTVEVNYIGKFENGSVFDTNVEEIGVSAGLKKTSYEPMEVKIGTTKLIPGFTAALINMKEGESKKITIPPAEAYGIKSKSKVVTLKTKEKTPRIIEMSRKVNVTLENLARLPGKNEVGDSVKVGDISYQVIDKDGQKAVLKLFVEEGDQLALPNTIWNSTVVGVEETTYTVRQDPENGLKINTPFGPARINVFNEELEREMLLQVGGYIVSPTGQGKVISVNKTDVVIDFNHPLAGKTLSFDIEIVGAE